MQKRWTKYYQSSHKNHHLHLTIDSLLASLILGLLVTNAYLSINNSGIVLGTQNNNGDINITTDPDHEQLTNGNPKTATTSLDQILEEKPLKIKPIKITLQSLARYYTPDGDQLGVGPLPPIFGQVTNYWLFISLADFDHDLENVVISANVPSNVILTGRESVSYGEDMSFEPNSKTVTWLLGNLVKAEASQVITVAFEVKLLPTENQIGSIAPLLTNIKVSALDSITKQIIVKYNPNITSRLVEDGLNNSDGIVIVK